MTQAQTPDPSPPDQVPDAVDERIARARCQLETGRDDGSRRHAHSERELHPPELPAKSSQRALAQALALTVGVMVLELAGGYWARSLALWSDAAHMATDASSLALALGVAWLAARPRSARMTFGYRRAEVLGALASSLGLWFLVGGLMLEAWDRLHAPEAVRAPLLLVVASIGLVANLVSLRLLRPHSHGLNVRAAALHVLMDTLGSVLAIVAGGIIWVTGWSWVDPMLTFVFAILILVSSWRLVRESVRVLMLSVPESVNLVQLEADLRAIEGVRAIDDLHAWCVSVEEVHLSAHVRVSNEADRARVLARCQELLATRYGVHHLTLQLE